MLTFKKNVIALTSSLSLSLLLSACGGGSDSGSATDDRASDASSSSSSSNSSSTGSSGGESSSSSSSSSSSNNSSSTSNSSSTGSSSTGSSGSNSSNSSSSTSNSSSSNSSSSSSSSGGTAVLELPELELQLSDVSFGIDLSAPVVINHSIPIAFTLGSSILDATPLETFPEDFSYTIPVTFVFVEKDPQNPEEPRQCSSNAIVVELIPGQGPTVVDDEVIWPISECFPLLSEGKAVELQVEFYHDDSLLPGEVDSTLPELNFKQSEPDVAYSLELDSSVAVVPLPQEENQEQENPEEKSSVPLLSVTSSFLFNGADPYFSLVTPEEIPDDLRQEEPGIEDELSFGLDQEALQNLDVLPGPTSLTYQLIPENNPEQILPLRIVDEAGSTLEAFTFTTLEPGVEEGISHHLYLDEAGLIAVRDGGSLAAEENFIVRGCVETSFVQGGNEFSSDNDCQEIPVQLVREVPADDLIFDNDLERTAGNKRLRMSAAMTTQNRLEGALAESFVEGSVSIEGKLGKKFSLDIVSASSKAVLTITGANAEAQLEMFGQSLVNLSESAVKELTADREFSEEKDREVGRLAFGFGPVRAGLTLRAGGRAGITGEVSMALLERNQEDCRELLGVDEEVASCGRLTGTVAPFFTITGRVFGGFKSRIVKVGVDANLDIIHTSFPLKTTLGFGTLDAEGRVVANGQVEWDAELIPIAGKVKLVGSIRFPFKRRSKTVVVINFKSKTHTFNMLSRSTGPIPIL